MTNPNAEKIFKEFTFLAAHFPPLKFDYVRVERWDADFLHQQSGVHCTTDAFDVHFEIYFFSSEGKLLGEVNRPRLPFSLWNPKSWSHQRDESVAEFFRRNDLLLDQIGYAVVVSRHERPTYTQTLDLYRLPEPFPTARAWMQELPKAA